MICCVRRSLVDEELKITELVHRPLIMRFLQLERSKIHISRQIARHSLNVTILVSCMPNLSYLDHGIVGVDFISKVRHIVPEV
jgi:hypothetical protein